MLMIAAVTDTGRPGATFKVTPTGMEALKRALQAYERLLDGLNLARGVHA